MNAESLGVCKRRQAGLHAIASPSPLQASVRAECPYLSEERYSETADMSSFDIPSAKDFIVSSLAAPLL